VIHFGRVPCKWFHKWKLKEKFWFSQVIHLGRVTGTWQAIRKMSIRNKWNPVGLRKIFIWIFTCENADIPYNFLYGASLVLHLCTRTCPRWFPRWFTSETFFLELKGTLRFRCISATLVKLYIFAVKGIRCFVPLTRSDILFYFIFFSWFKNVWYGKSTFTMNRMPPRHWD